MGGRIFRQHLDHSCGFPVMIDEVKSFKLDGETLLDIDEKVFSEKCFLPWRRSKAVGLGAKYILLAYAFVLT